MAPIRIGIIGLSSTAKTAWASTAHLPYLNASKHKYAITALCNSSVASAKSAIETYGLPQSTRAYGNPQDLANDEEVGFVIQNPSTRGKDVYVEWPLAQDLKHAEELLALANEKGSRTMVGLQGRASPVILKVKSLIDQGKVGKVLSGSVNAIGGTSDRNSIPASLKYFTDKSVGGNVLTIFIGHISDFMHFTLGEFSSITSRLAIQRPEVNLRGSDGKIIETVTSDVPDHISIIGDLASGAPVTINLRRGQPFKGSPGFLWNINGELGEIRVTASSPAFSALDAAVKIEIHNFANDDVEEVKWQWDDTSLPVAARGGAV